MGEYTFFQKEFFEELARQESAAKESKVLRYIKILKFITVGNVSDEFSGLFF